MLVCEGCRVLQAVSRGLLDGHASVVPPCVLPLSLKGQRTEAWLAQGVDAGVWMRVCVGVSLLAMCWLCLPVYRLSH
jgi:hypothetical protein